MEIAFLPPAKGELTEAISYYNAQSEGLDVEEAVRSNKSVSPSISAAK
jgi:hypothetical protein